MNFVNLFQIDNDGNLFTTRILDREQEGIYELQVLATDGPIMNEDLNDKQYNSGAMLFSTPYNTATAIVTVTVLDLNDNTPHFVHPTNTSSPVGDVHFLWHLENWLFRI